MISLDSLTERLMLAVPAWNEKPTSDQYQQAVIEAAADFSRRAPMTKATMLKVTLNQPMYLLPDDFVRLIRLEGGYNGAGLINSAEGLIPVGSDFREQIAVAGRTLSIYPTPGYTMRRRLLYQAAYVEVEGNFEDMTEDAARVVLLKAQATALTLQANAAAQRAWQYQIGDERVNMERQAGEMRAQAEALERTYLEAVTAYVGIV